MRAEALHKLELERQSKMRPAPLTREERERKLASMTQEEKEAFFEEEKDQKKEMWAKKQVRCGLLRCDETPFTFYERHGNGMRKRREGPVAPKTFR